MTEKLKNYFGDEKEKRKLIITYCVTLIVFLLVFFSHLRIFKKAEH